MPEGPFSPTATITTEARISVINVIPDTGLVPTMAIALAANGVKKKGMQKRPSVEKVKELLDALSCHQTLYDLLMGEEVQR